MENLKIVARLGSPLMGDWTFPIDGVLCALACAKNYPSLDGVRPNEGFEYDPSLVPIEIVPHSTWFYAASFAVWGKYVESQEYWNKRFDYSDAERRTKADSVDSTLGQYKGYHQRVVIRSTKTLIWYVRGDKRRIQDLLATCVGIGKKTSQGYGSILDWSVNVAAEDNSVFCANILMRAVPMTFCAQPNNAYSATRGVRPSYWDRTHWTQVWTPR